MICTSNKHTSYVSVVTETVLESCSPNAIILPGGKHYSQKKKYNWNKIRKEFQESDLTYSALKDALKVLTALC